MSEPVMGWVVCRPRAARRVALLATALSLFGAVALPTAAQAAGDTPAAAVFAIESPKAAKGLMIDVVHAGKRLVAVGDRGHILYSDDQGATWTQAKVPTRQLLTAVFFVDDKQGWAVGHDAQILASTDGGATWTQVLPPSVVSISAPYAPTARPWLALLNQMSSSGDSRLRS